MSEEPGAKPDKKSWFKTSWVVAFVFFFIGIGVGGQGGRNPAGENQELRAEASQLKAQLAKMTSARNRLKAALDPIRRAEEASATAAAAQAAADAKAKTDAEAQAAAAKAKADAEAQAAAAKAAAEEAANTFTDGVYLVGSDIKPGTYRGTVTGDTGYWARLRDTNGGLNSIIANSIPSGPFVLTILSSDNAVELKGVKLIKM